MALMDAPVSTDAPKYELATVVPAEGARVGLSTCLRCGAALLFDARGVDPVPIHDAWHARQAPEVF